MNISKMKPQMIRNQNNGNNQGGSGGNQDDKSKTPQTDPNAEAKGDQPNPSQQGNEGLGYENLEDVSVGEYGGDGLVPKQEKAHEKIKLGYELEGLEGMSESEILEIKQFAQANGLSKEAAKAFVGSKKNDILKFRQHLEVQKQTYQDKVKAYKQGEYQKLVAAIGGEGGKEFKGNLKKTNDFLAQHLPDLKKEIDEKGVFLSASVMTNIFNFQAKLLKEENLVNGGQKQQTDDQPSWQKLFKEKN